MTTENTKPFRVVGVGAIYQKQTETVGTDGKLVTLMVPTLAVRGSTVDLTDYEAKRLTDLGAVKPADSDLDYDEQSDEDLQREVDARGLEVRGTAADGAVRREDLINALTIHDQGGASGQGASDPGTPGQGTSDTSGQFDPAAADVTALAEHIQSNVLNADDTVALAGGDPERALRVLDAEKVATGNAPRLDVEQGLEKIVDGHTSASA